MINKQVLRRLRESLQAGGTVRKLYHLMGLADERGNRYRNAAGNPILKNPRNSAGGEEERLRPSEFSLRELAEGLIGEDWSRKMNPDVTRQIAESEESRPILEAAGTGALMPTDFIDINAFTATVSGLLEVALLEAWQNPEYISDQLMPDEPTKVFGGKKIIGTGRAGDVAEQRQPGMPTKRVQFGERWVTTPATVENALSIEVTQEAVYLDLTGEVTKQAADIGDWLRWRKEIRCIDCFLGVTNTYSYNGTAYNTYLTSGFYTNSITSNELLHWTNIQTILLTFRDMLDPTTNTRVLIKPNRILVNMEKLFTAQAILGAREVEYRDIPGSTSAAQNIRHFNNPLAGVGLGNPLQSPLVYQRATDSDGLALSATNAGKLYYVWEYGRPFKYMQNWPLRFQTAAPNNIDMIDRGIVAFYKADERGVPAVIEPRTIVKSAA